MSKALELVIFENFPDKVKNLINSGYQSFIVDQEYIGKDLRQLGFDTEINRCEAKDIAAIAAIENCKVWTRINSFGVHTKDEIDNAIRNGAHVIILPMVRSLDEVHQFLHYVDKRSETCVMIETQQAVTMASELEKTSTDSFYFGLNDFAIATNSNNIFQPIQDGVLERTRRLLKTKRFGFGGLTHAALGKPISSLRIVEELERLDCSITFLRRSFKRDLSKFSAKEILESIQDAWDRTSMRSNLERSKDIAAFRDIIASM